MLPAESVSSNLSHRIDDGRCRIDREGRGHRSGAERGGTMAGTSELTGVVESKPMATVHTEIARGDGEENGEFV